MYNHPLESYKRGDTLATLTLVQVLLVFEFEYGNSISLFTKPYRSDLRQHIEFGR